VRVLLVDDSKTIRRIERGILEQLGYTEIEEACDGQDALSRVTAFEPTLILLDWNMPNMDGIEFLTAFRQKDATTPVIMVTTESEKSRVIEAVRAGVNNYVVKPFTLDILQQRIKETLDKRKTAA
jgi:two-component system chemotaxis response regulator CheY